MERRYVVALGAAIAVALVLSVGTVYGMAPWVAPRQAVYRGGMMGAYGYGSGQQGSYANYAGGMMGGYGGMMGGYGGMMAGFGGYRGMMGQYHAQAGNTTSGSAFVVMVNDGFYPANLAVSRGTTVTWVNMDFVQHTVTSGSDQAPTSLFDSHELNHMQSFSYTFSTPGTYNYFCDIHPGMTGTITVSA